MNDVSKSPEEVRLVDPYELDLDMLDTSLFIEVHKLLNPDDDQIANWDGICVRCGTDFFESRGNNTCNACNAQRQDMEQKLQDEDEELLEVSVLEIHRTCLAVKSSRDDIAKIIAEHALQSEEFPPSSYLRTSPRDEWMVDPL